MTPTDRFFIRKGCKWYLDFKSYCTSSSQAHLTLSAMLLYIFLLACALNSTKKKNKTRETDLHPHVTCLSQIELLTLVFKCHIPLQFPLTKADLFFFAHGKKKTKTWEHGRLRDCLLSFFISLCKHRCVRGISLFSDARVLFFFSFMPRFSWNSYREWHTRGALADSESCANKTPLMKRAKEPLMSRKFMRLIPAALCSSRPSTYGLSRQIRNGTCTPPLFLNNQHLLFPLVCLPHNIFVPLCTAHWGGCRELSRSRRRNTLIDIWGKSK